MPEGFHEAEILGSEMLRCNVGLDTAAAILAERFPSLFDADSAELFLLANCLLAAQAEEVSRCW